MGYLKMVQQDLSAITAPCELPGKKGMTSSGSYIIWTSAKNLHWLYENLPRLEVCSI